MVLVALTVSSCAGAEPPLIDEPRFDVFAQSLSQECRELAPGLRVGAGPRTFGCPVDGLGSKLLHFRTRDDLAAQLPGLTALRLRYVVVGANVWVSSDSGDVARRAADLLKVAVVAP